MYRRAAVNVITSAILKLVGISYSFVIVGMAARHISIEETGELLLAFSFLAPLGLVQAGMGVFVLRAVIRNHASGGPIANISELGAFFRFTTSVAFVALIVMVAISQRTGLDFIMPIAALVLIGAVCSVADQIWIGTERAWVVNICLAFSFSVLSVLFAAMQFLQWFDLPLIAIVTYGAPATASIFSFCVLARQRAFRRNLVSRPSMGSLHLLRAGSPIFLVSIASSALIVLPTASLLWPRLPELSNNEIPLLRIATIFASSTVTLLVPLLPTLIVSIHRIDGAARRRIAFLLPCGVIFFVICLVPTLHFGLPSFLKLWIGIEISGEPILLPWAAVIALWMGAAISGQLALLLCNPIAVATVVLACDLTVVALMLVGAFGAPVTVSSALVGGLAVHLVLALVLVYRHLVRI